MLKSTESKMSTYLKIPEDKNVAENLFKSLKDMALDNYIKMLINPYISRNQKSEPYQNLVFLIK